MVTAPEPLTPMMPPVGVKAVVLSSTSVLLTWTDTSLGRNQHPTDNRYYVIRYNPKLVRKPRLVNTTELNLHIDDLRPDTEYEFSIKVVKGQRQSTWSLSVFNQTGQAGNWPRRTDFLYWSIYRLRLKLCNVIRNATRSLYYLVQSLFRLKFS